MFQVLVNEQEKQLLSCQDRRQNGTCRCIERYVLSDLEQEKQVERLRFLLQVSCRPRIIKFVKLLRVISILN